MKFESNKIPINVIGVYNSLYPIKVQTPDFYMTRISSELVLSTEGIIHSRHLDSNMKSGPRQSGFYTKGTEIKNYRQWVMMSEVEFKGIARELNLEGQITPGMLGVNILVSGIDSVSSLRMGKYLLFSPHSNYDVKRPEDVVLVSHCEISPCHIPGRGIEFALGREKNSVKFESAAKGRRGLAGYVEKGGSIKPGYFGWILTPTGIE